MGELICGCKIEAGLPVSNRQLREHYRHTLQVLMFWELLKRPDSSTLAKTRLSAARSELFFAIDTLYPDINPYEPFAEKPASAKEVIHEGG
ncbi:MAG: hypothetical protein M0R06_06550 [Sphaerochaeta sp.]|jgi:hypothetical protein|nr:hypothetical protein [Sphaerochaeta sp.]MDD4986237.1 hypothetical protein [Dehalococcoidales bacterium]